MAQRNYVRLFVRTKCDHPIRLTYSHEGKDVVLDSRCTNLCVGGFFADLPQALDLGQAVVVEFLPDHKAGLVRLNAEVRHVHEKETGFQFLAQGEAEQETLRQFFRTRTEDLE